MNDDLDNNSNKNLDSGEEETLFEFPCEFPIKCMGLNNSAFEGAVIEIMNRHVPDLGEGAITTRASKEGKYCALTITITATSKQQLDAIYMDLTACDHVNMSL